jgi:hypothetical protein
MSLRDVLLVECHSRPRLLDLCVGSSNMVPRVCVGYLFWDDHVPKGSPWSTCNKRNTFMGYNLMHNIVIMDEESTNRQFIARILETPPRDGHGDQVPERSPWSAMPFENTCLGVQPHARLRDHGSGVHESAIYCSNPGLLPEMVMATMSRLGHHGLPCH